MKLKKRHRKIAKTISSFVERTDLYFPDFIEPTEEQIQLFFEIESKGSKGLSEEQLKIVAPMLNGKENYDLQIKMVHEELLEWMCNKWGWGRPISQMIKDCYKSRHNIPSYVKFLRDLKKRMSIDGWNGKGLVPPLAVMLSYSGFTEQQKNRLIESI